MQRKRSSVDPVAGVRLLRKAQVCELLGVSSWTISDWLRRGQFPKPIFISPGSPMRFRLSEIQRWLDTRAAKRRTPLQKIIRDRPNGYDTLDEAIEAILEAEGCSGTEAMARAARQYPDLLRKYNQEGIERLAKVAATPAAKTASTQEKQKFDLLVEGIAERERVPRHVAMERARHRHPEKFELAYPKS